MTKIENCIDANNFVQRIEKKAYELYVSRGYAQGHDWDDWFEAQKAVEIEISAIDRDCIRSESFYKTAHRSNPVPSEINPQLINTNPFSKDI